MREETFRKEGVPCGVGAVSRLRMVAVFGSRCRAVCGGWARSLGALSSLHSARLKAAIVSPCCALFCAYPVLVLVLVLVVGWSEWRKYSSRAITSHDLNKYGMSECFLKHNAAPVVTITCSESALIEWSLMNRGSSTSLDPWYGSSMGA